MMDLQIMAIAEWILPGERGGAEKNECRIFGSVVLQSEAGSGDREDFCKGLEGTVCMESPEGIGRMRVQSL